MCDEDFAARAYHAGCELRCLSRLVGAMIEQLDTIGDRAEPLIQAAVVADEARIAFDYLVLVAARLNPADRR